MHQARSSLQERDPGHVSSRDRTRQKAARLQKHVWESMSGHCGYTNLKLHASDQFISEMPTHDDTQMTSSSLNNHEI